jgi:hypothetical protein
MLLWIHQDYRLDQWLMEIGRSNIFPVCAFKG